MKFGIKYNPSFAMLGIGLGPEESVRVEAGSMVGMSADMNVETSLNASYGADGGGGGFLKGLVVATARKFLGGETLFINTYTAGEKGGQLMVAPALSGDIIHYPLKGDTLMVQASSYMASSPGVGMELKFGGLSTLFGGEGLFLIKTHGNGDLFVNSYGAVKTIDIDGSFIIDTGHIVAFEESLDFEVRRIGSWKSTMLSGEGLVCEFKGKGRLYYQTRNLGAMIGWLTKLLPS